MRYAPPASTTAAAAHPWRWNMVRRAEAFVVGPDDGQSLRGPAGGGARIVCDGDATDGSFAMLEVTIGPMQGPPQHSHRREDEMWYILDGSFRFVADDQQFEVHPGGFVFVPRGSTHCFQNTTSAPAKLLVMFTPSGMERFFIEHAELPPGPVDEAAYAAIADRSWMTVTGPPLAVSHGAGSII